MYLYHLPGSLVWGHELDTFCKFLASGQALSSMLITKLPIVPEVAFLLIG